MAQLSDDCFAFGGPTLSLADARALLDARVQPVAGLRRIPLAEADGRVLAADLAAPIDLPPFENSAVDGYAVRFSDLTPDAPTRLPVSGRVPAGASPASAAPRSAVRIFTGAPMPDGLDTVFMQEDVALEGDAACLPAGLKRGANRRLAGEDLPRGALALWGGTRLTPREIALIAACGYEAVDVREPVRVAVFSTGDEIVAPGNALRPGALYDANRFMVAALLRRLGCAVTDLGILPDRRDIVAAALKDAAAAHDLLLTSGGVSTGEEDHVKAAVEDAGSLTFWRIAIKPGRPVALGVVSGVPFIGLPGNPAAVFVTFVNVARVLVARLAGERYAPPVPFPTSADFAYRKKEGRREYVRASLLRTEDGTMRVRKHPREGAGIVTSLTQTDGLVELPEEVTRVEIGETVGFLPYSDLV